MYAFCSVRIILKIICLTVLLSCPRLTESLADSCGFYAPEKDTICGCYPHLGAIDCIGLNLRFVPDFSQLSKKYWYLDLRRNVIPLITFSDLQALKNFKIIDVRENPINCMLQPMINGLKTDCALFSSMPSESGSTVGSLSTTSSKNFINNVTSSMPSESEPSVNGTVVTDVYNEEGQENIVLIVFTTLLSLLACALSVYIFWLKYLKNKLQGGYRLLEISDTNSMDDEQELFTISTPQSTPQDSPVASTSRESAHNSTPIVSPSDTVSSVLNPSGLDISPVKTTHSSDIQSTDGSTLSMKDESTLDSTLTVNRQDISPSQDPDEIIPETSSSGIISPSQDPDEIIVSESLFDETSSLSVNNDKINDSNVSQDETRVSNVSDPPEASAPQRYNLRPNPGRKIFDDFHYYK
jgi:hypothetical protein